MPPCVYRVLAPALLTGVGALGVLSSLNSSLTASCSRFEDKQLSVYLGQANYMQEQPLFPRACLGLPTLLSFILFISLPLFQTVGLGGSQSKGSSKGTAVPCTQTAQREAGMVGLPLQGG